ncbi:MAG: tetratricopeptide repeat protein [Pseudomonadota bacterium]|nr:tetratricopeptide repeat protein [Pseudomonadota bacterium]
MKNNITAVRTCFSYLLFAVLFWQSPVAIAGQNTVLRDDWYISQPDNSATIQMSGHASAEAASVETAAVPVTTMGKSSHQKKQNNKQELVPEVRKINAQEHVMLRKAQSAFTRNHYMKSHELWLPLAESGIAEAQYSLGFLYQSGWGPERDLQKAVAWYISAAEQNEARAQFNLGVLFLGGEDEIDKDVDTAMFWLTRSAENNNIRAKEFLIKLYSEGQYGIEQSNDKADYWRSH